MRTWDGVITTGSVAAEIVDATKQALWPLVLEPKLGADWKLYDWQSKNFVQEEMVEKAPPEWLPAKYKSWDELIAAAVHQGHGRSTCPIIASRLDLWQPACDRRAAPSVRDAALFPELDQHRAPPAVRVTRPRSTTCADYSGCKPAPHGGLEQCRRLDGKHCDGRVRRPTQPVLTWTSFPPGIAARPLPCPSPRRPWPRRPRILCDWCLDDHTDPYLRRMPALLIACTALLATGVLFVTGQFVRP